MRQPQVSHEHLDRDAARHVQRVLGLDNRLRTGLGVAACEAQWPTHRPPS
jgi:hypothetical protein